MVTKLSQKQKVANDYIIRCTRKRKNNNYVILVYFRIMVMGTQERLSGNVLVDQLMDGIATNCPRLERLELKWDPDNLRFSDKSQKAIDIFRVKCLKLKCLVLR